MKRIFKSQLIHDNEYLMVTEDKKMTIVRRVYHLLHIQGDNVFKLIPIPKKAKFYQPN